MPKSRKRIKVVRSTGIRVETKQKHGAPLPKPNGQHYWINVVCFRVTNPAADRFDMDLENLITVQGPACLNCERQYEPGMENTPCPGDPLQ